MSTLNDEDRDNLAAFLDGELDEHTSQALEAKLNRDPEARQEMEALRRAWSMLDFLPRPEPSPSFTNRTMERLTMAVPRGVATARMPAVRRGRWLLACVWGAAVLLALILGAMAGSLLWHPDDPLAGVLAQHEHMIDHLTLYEQIADLNFLKSLDQPDLFAEEPSFEEPDNIHKPWKQTVSASRRLALARTFLELPAERREQLVKLDQDLRAEADGVRERLLGVAHRYKVWFDHLGIKEQELVTGEADRDKQLAAIKKLRKLTKSWDLAVRFWDVRNSMLVRMRDLPKDVQDYYSDYLKFMLTAEEKERLTRAENQWPLYLQTLVELADKHPPALPGPEGPKSLAELPKEVKEKLKIVKGGKALKAKEVWPIFADAVSELAFKRGVILPNELWPTHNKCLEPPMELFLTKKLMPALSDDELHKLRLAIGRWPDYPKTIQELATAHKMQPPWFTLPGPRGRWDVYRLPKGDGP